MPKKRLYDGDDAPSANKKAATSSCDNNTAATSSCDVVDTLYTDVDGYAIARTAKETARKNGVFQEGIQYGEVKPSSFEKALAWLEPRPGESFIDLGSGTGKAVLTAAAAYPFATAVGVEIVKALHDAAEAALARGRGGGKAGGGGLKAAEVRFVCADALKFPWTNGSYACIFVSLTCFTDEMVATVKRGVESLPKGTRMLVTSRPLESASLKLIRRETLPYAKGTLTFIAYEKV